ncbi:Hypothetical protein UVM_LOCUS216 [uncultured virus]|nr:Hypothetical protein UVM_LOCUS216 [uncultured virus]
MTDRTIEDLIRSLKIIGRLVPGDKPSARNGCLTIDAGGWTQVARRWWHGGAKNHDAITAIADAVENALRCNNIHYVVLTEYFCFPASSSPPPRASTHSLSSVT